MQALKKSIDIAEYAKELLKQTGDIEMPSMNSPFFLKHGCEYIEAIESKSIFILRKTNYPHDFSKINMNDRAIGFAIFIELKRELKLQTFNDVPKHAGFDLDILPDQEFLLKFLYHCNKKHEIFNDFPTKKESKLTKLQQTALINTLINGGKLKKQNGIEIDKEVIRKYNEGALAYMMCKFKLKEIKSQLSTIRKIAESNQHVNAILNENTNAINELSSNMQIE